MVRRGNSTWGARGDLHPGAKLTNAQAEEIRQTYAAGGVTQSFLGEYYGVDRTTIRNVVVGRTYREMEA
jgi:hypothetical protein